MRQLKVSVNIPIINRNINDRIPITDKELINAISLALNTNLRDFCKIYNDVELGPISVNKVVFTEDDKYTDFVKESIL